MIHCFGDGQRGVEGWWVASSLKEEQWRTLRRGGVPVWCMGGVCGCSVSQCVFAQFVSATMSFSSTSVSKNETCAHSSSRKREHAYSPVSTTMWWGQLRAEGTKSNQITPTTTPSSR